MWTGSGAIRKEVCVCEWGGVAGKDVGADECVEKIAGGVVGKEEVVGRKRKITRGDMCMARGRELKEELQGDLQ